MEPLPISWLTDVPVWVPQWPLSQEKLEAVNTLVLEQVNAGHLIPSTSPWNTPIFAIRKKLGQWRLLHDLRAVNAQMQPMGPVQRGLPLLSALPNQWPVIVIDLKDCFFSIPLDKKDTPRFAFTVPTQNQEQPDKRWEWTVLPQGMTNSPTMCQVYVAQVLKPLRDRYSDCRCLHYMDDLLCAAPTAERLLALYSTLQQVLEGAGLHIAPNKVQLSSVVSYLGAIVAPTQIRPQKIQIKINAISTLNDLQKLLGDINWIRPYLNIPNAALQPLFNILKGDPDLASPRTFTSEAKQALSIVNDALSKAALKRWDPAGDLTLWVLDTLKQPTAVLWQDGPLLWIHPSMSSTRSISYYPVAVAEITLLAIQRAIQHFGREPSTIVVPYSMEQVRVLIACTDAWAVLVCSTSATITNRTPSDPLLTFVQSHPVIFPKSTSQKPLQGAPVVYTDGSKTGVGAYVVSGSVPKTFQFATNSPQVTELLIVNQVFSDFPGPVNIVSDSRYVVNSVSILEAAGLVNSSSSVATVFLTLQKSIWNRSAPFFITHIRAHSSLPGPMTTGNAIADQATRPIWILQFSSPEEQAIQFHSEFHVNAKTLAAKFGLSRAAARDIVRHCAACPTLTPVPSVGVNPRGLLPGHIWQMDVTHISEFGTLKYVHVSVDTCSQVIFASLETGERTTHVINHCLAAWAAWGKPKTLKTDNGPAYTSKSFQDFCTRMQVQHKTGIPYNPQGQAIIERAHRTLKAFLLKQKEGIATGKTPRMRLSLALFTINFLNLTDHSMSPAERHMLKEPSSRGYVRWKDVLTGKWYGPDPVLCWNRGAVCVFPQESGREPLWIPERLVRKTAPPPQDTPLSPTDDISPEITEITTLSQDDKLQQNNET